MHIFLYFIIEPEICMNIVSEFVYNLTKSKRKLVNTSDQLAYIPVPNFICCAMFMKDYYQRVYNVL